MASRACSTGFWAPSVGSRAAWSFSFCCCLAICCIDFWSCCLPDSPGFLPASAWTCWVCLARSRCSLASCFAVSALALSALARAACSFATSRASFSAASAARSSCGFASAGVLAFSRACFAAAISFVASLRASDAPFGSRRSVCRAMSDCWSAAFFAASGACSLRAASLARSRCSLAMAAALSAWSLWASLSARSRRASAASRLALARVVGLPGLLRLRQRLVGLLLLGLRLLAAADLLGLVGDALLVLPALGGGRLVRIGLRLPLRLGGGLGLLLRQALGARGRPPPCRSSARPGAPGPSRRRPSASG